MKPDLLAGADEAYGPPNPGMRCAEALASKKDLGTEPAHKLSPQHHPPPSSSPLPLPPPASVFKKKPKKNPSKHDGHHLWLAANQLDPIYERTMLRASPGLCHGGLACYGV